MRGSTALGAACALVLVSGMQFDVEAGRTKCLGEIIGKHDLVKGSFAILGTEGGRSDVDVKILSPSDTVEFSSTAQLTGKFAFTGNEEGSHRVCFNNLGQSRRRVELSWAAGAEAKDYEDLAKKEHLKPIELELRKLEDRVEAIALEMGYQREREESHRDINESTNSKVQLFSMLTIGIVLVQACLQVWHLYTFFRKKKFI